MLTKYRSFIVFCSIGGLNTILDIGLYLLLRGAGTPILIANVISTSIALTFSYILNRRFTFQSSTDPKSNILAFLAVTLTGLWILQPIIIHMSLGLLEQTNMSTTMNDLLSKLIATPATLLWNYILYKNVVFKDKV